MGILQDILQSQVQQHLSLDNLCSRLIYKRLKQKGVTLSEEQLAEIELKLRKAETDPLTIVIEDDQLPAVASKCEEAMRNILQVDLADSQADIEELVEEFSEGLSEAIPKLADEVSALILGELKKDAKSLVKARRQERTAFEARLADTWARPLDLLDLFLMLALEAGATFNREFGPTAAEQNDRVFEVLTRLHARACQIGSEVLALLRAGHADGAHARWRSLHEIAVVGFFIASAGDDIAERYVLHDAIESYQAAQEYQRHCRALGYEALSDDEFSDIESAYTELVARFGPTYRDDYGWAAPALGKKGRPTFKAIEKKAGLGHLRPFYKMACHNVHAGAKGVFFRLGLYPRSQHVLLAGPSDTGLADPGQGTAISLGQITTALLSTRPSMDSIVTCTVLMKVSEEIGDEFVAVQQAVECDKPT